MTLQAAFNFDEASGDVLDRSGNGHDWSLNNGAVRTASGHTNGGLTKNASGLPVIANPSFVGSNAWTIMFWQQGLGNAVWWLRLYNISEDTGSGILFLGGDVHARFRKGGNPNAVTATAPADGLAHHYCATYDGSVGRFYIDAVQVGSIAVAAPLATVDLIDGLEFTTGATHDDHRYFDTALDQATIESLMNTPVEADAGLEIAPSGIASVEAFGTPVLSASVTVSPSSIASLEAFGTPSVTDGDTPTTTRRPMELVGELNRLAGTTGLEEAGAANAWAGTVGLETVGALNAKAGTSGLGLDGVCNQLAGTEGLGAPEALSRIP